MKPEEISPARDRKILDDQNLRGVFESNDSDQQEVLNKSTESSVDEKISFFRKVIDNLRNRLKIVSGEVGKNNSNNIGSDKKGVENARNYSDNPNSQSRRNFLKLAGKVGLGMAVGGVVTKFASDVLEGERLVHKNYGANNYSGWEVGQGLQSRQEMIGQVKEQERKEKAIKEEIEEEKKEGITREKGEINYRDLRMLLSRQYLVTKSINLISIKKAIKNYWLQEYDAGGSQHYGLTQALDRMTEWHNEVQEVFSRVFMAKELECPDWLVYLGIAESHWAVKKNKKATSSVGAGGVYQLMPKLARAYGLEVNTRKDERYNVIANTRVAAEYLADLYKDVVKNMKLDRTSTEQNWNSDSWKLALALYNGGFARKFFQWAKKNKQVVNYNSYLEFRGQRLEKFIKNRLDKKIIYYTIQKGDSLFKIAKEHKGLTVEKIKKDNRLKSDNIRVGQALILVIPAVAPEQTNEELKTILSQKGPLSGALENLNYPEKFIGILEALEKNNLFIKPEKDKIPYSIEANDGFISLKGTPKRKL